LDEACADEEADCGVQEEFDVQTNDGNGAPTEEVPLETLTENKDRLIIYATAPVELWRRETERVAHKLHAALESHLVRMRGR
jgi:hypothetical protein